MAVYEKGFRGDDQAERTFKCMYPIFLFEGIESIYSLSFKHK